jgi:hemin uptake protein HemP
MDAATKKAADREYVDRFFHGVASKLMTHPYFSKFANQANMAVEVPASTASLESVLAKVAAAKKVEAEAEAAAKKGVAEGIVNSVARTPVSLEQYKKNMAHVRELFGKRSDLLEKYKLCKTKDSRVPVGNAIIEIDGMIKEVYATSKIVGVDLNKYDSINCLSITPSTPKQTSSWVGPRYDELSTPPQPTIPKEKGTAASAQPPPPIAMDPLMASRPVAPQQAPTALTLPLPQRQMASAQLPKPIAMDPLMASRPVAPEQAPTALTLPLPQRQMASAQLPKPIAMDPLMASRPVAPEQAPTALTLPLPQRQMASAQLPKPIAMDPLMASRTALSQQAPKANSPPQYQRQMVSAVSPDVKQQADLTQRRRLPALPP